MKKITALVSFILFLSAVFPAQAIPKPTREAIAPAQKINRKILKKDEAEPAKDTENFSPKTFFKDRELDIFPVPVYERRPDRGNSYGLMPILLLSDKDTKAIKTILGVIGQYNSVTKFDGSLLAYLYPGNQEIEFFFDWAQKFAREASVRYFNPEFGGKFYLDANISYLQTPFGLFYGIGTNPREGNRTNHVSESFTSDITFGYTIRKFMRVNLTSRVHSYEIKTRAKLDIPDTLTTFAGLANVASTTNLIWSPSFTYDSRPDREYSKRGSYVNLSGIVSSKNLGSQRSFRGLSLEMIQMMPLIEDRLTQVFRFQFQQLFGSNIPFYEMNSMGGPNDFRSFTPNRYVDRGKMTFQLEERFKLFGAELFGIPFEGHIDPFVEVGRVFDSANHLGFSKFQAVAGTGLRLFVPPNVIGRLDMAVGVDGFEIYTMLGYPF